MLHRKIVKFAVPLAAGVLALSACSSNGKSGGGGKSGGSGGGKTVTIGLQGPLSGANAQLGINVKDGVQLAFNQFNAKPNKPFTVKLATSDDEGDPSKANAAATQLIQNNSIKAVIGPIFSGPTKASEPLYSSASLLSITPSATNPQLTTQGFTSFLQGIANDNLQGKAMADYITKKLTPKPTKVYVIDDKSEYGVGLANVARADLKADGVQVVSDSVPAGTPDYSGPAAKVANSKATALIYAGYYADAAPLAKKLHDAGYTGAVFSDDGAKDPQLVKLAGTAVNNWYLTCPCTDPTVQASTKTFATQYTSTFKTPPSTYSAEGYDEANMLLQQITKLGAGVSRQALLAAMKTADYKGISKEFSFKSTGQFKGTDVWIYQVKSGKITFLGNVNQLVGSAG
ncbi:branched chain amino acid ABC transporter substrate-binding protein [Mangrovactinospora gilvigrisea]|uniref:Branched chain amino acid ABC transporter substrate-binding protein n=1 Tax=Mangrovactinospora gilvigrisea TaxID=1428644 RepID=A0A1J7B9Y9_9ACTN|nr:branched-chain amino acid ABC transporter substrate-binding protein [Mangrovactinospora gilvigrisea]OIV35413.1 branched chain amino acid ABC transporter substrate-binding protein [Mangrovactinospora gilvigrisea]